ncbi:hypothetical protein M8C21_007198, partial [Ambrosia artemisiifolia]
MGGEISPKRFLHVVATFCFPELPAFPLHNSHSHKPIPFSHLLPLRTLTAITVTDLLPPSLPIIRLLFCTLTPVSFCSVTSPDYTGGHHRGFCLKWLLLRMMVSKWWCDIGVLMASWCWYEVGGYCALGCWWEQPSIPVSIGFSEGRQFLQGWIHKVLKCLLTYFVASLARRSSHCTGLSYLHNHGHITTFSVDCCNTDLPKTLSIHADGLILAFFMMRFEHVGSRRNARVIINWIESIVISVLLGHIKDLSHTFGGLHFVTGNANFCHHMKMNVDNTKPKPVVILF